MTRFWLVIAALIISLQVFSQDPTFINASEVIAKGKALYDSGKYKESIAEYLTLPKRDTGYVNMLSELVTSYIAAEEFDKALSTCEEGLTKVSIYRANFVRSQAVATDRKGDYDKALELFAKGIAEYPADFILLYNLGITYYNHKEYDKAVDCFFKVLDMNPFHPGSHLNLGRLSAAQGKKTHAMLSFGMYLGISNTDNERLVFLEKYLSNQFAEEGSIPATGVNAFDKLDQIIRAKIAMDKNYKSKIDIDAAIVKQYQMFFDQLETATDVEDRWSKFYLPIYKTLKGEGMVEPFIYYLLKSSSIELVKKWHQKNTKKLEEFYQITNAAIKAKRETIVMPALGFDKPTRAWHNNINRIEAIGNETANGIRQGRWVYLKNNFERSAEGSYSDGGKKVGTWRYYKEDGTVSSIENYDTGEVTVFQDGVKSQHFILKDGKIHGSVELFDACGILNESLLYDRGKRHGSGKTWYASGKAKSTYTYDSGKVTGTFTNYFESGKIRNVLNYKSDLLNGQYLENFANGKLKSIGHYTDDKLTGVWKYYHPNGRLESTGNYEKGIAVGEWNFYTVRGKHLEKKVFDKDGKVQGDNIIYYNGKVHYIHNYKNDLLIGVTYLDSAGKELGKFGHATGTFNVQQFYPTGMLSGKGSYKNGKMHGTWVFYYPEGSKRSEFVYNDGLIQGDATEYFRTGAKKYSFHYKDGKFDGRFEEFYPHGQFKQRGWFMDGERQQQWLTFYPDGVLELDYYYLNGELSGRCYDYSTTGQLFSATDFEADRLTNIGTYHPDGTNLTKRVETPTTVSFKTHYSNGKPQSEFQTQCGKYSKVTKWFPNGNVFYQYDLAGGQKEGAYQYNAINGKNMMEGNFVNGEEEGIWKGFYYHGQLDYLGRYLMGKSDSTWIYYFPNGKISSISKFVEDDRDGITKIFGPDGSALLEKFYVEGRLTSYREVIGEQAGVWKSFSENTTIVAHYANGKKAYEEHYKQGVLSGPKRIYYPDGILYSEFDYALGDNTGDYRVNYPNGKVMEKGTYKWDELHGAVEKYNEDGTPYIIENFVMGSRSGKASLYEKGQKKLEYVFYGGLPYE